MVIMNTKQVKLVWATKPRPEAEMEARRRVYATANGVAIPRPLVRRRSLDNKTRPTTLSTLVIRREATAIESTPIDRVDRVNNPRPSSVTPITLVKTDSVKSHSKKPAITPPATKTTDLKPILKTSKPEAKAEETRVREALSAGLDNKFSYRLPDKPVVTKPKKSVTFKESDIPSNKVLTTSRRQYSPIYTVQFTGSSYRPDMLQKRQIFV